MASSVRQILDHKGHEFHSVGPGDSVFAALGLMAEQNTGCVLVMDGDALVGIFTERDYARKVVLKGLSSTNVLVGELMTSNPVTVNLSTTVDEVMNLMTERRFRHMPVLEDGKVVGIVTIGDMVKSIVSDQKSTISQLQSYIAGDFSNN